MKKFFMTVMFVFMLASVSFGAEKKRDYEYMEYYTDIVDPAYHDRHEFVEEGEFYISTADNSGFVYWFREDNSIVCEKFAFEDGSSRFLMEVTAIENGEDTIYFVDYGDGNEQVYTD